MSFCVSKINGNLIFNDLGGYERRNPSTFWCIQKADEKYNFLTLRNINNLYIPNPLLCSKAFHSMSYFSESSRYNTERSKI
jgi:hypothetical protein